MEDLITICYWCRRNIGCFWGARCFCEFIFEVCFCCIAYIPFTTDVWLIYTCFEFTRSLGVGTFLTGTSSSVPGLWRETTCSWFVVSWDVITTHSLDSSDDTTLVFVVCFLGWICLCWSVYTVSTLARFFSLTETIVVTHRCVTSGSTWETFLLSSTVELSDSAGRWDTTVFDRIPS